MELNWQNGQIVVHNGSKRPLPRSNGILTKQSNDVDFPFKNGDEIDSLLHYQLDNLVLGPDISELYYPKSPTQLSPPSNTNDVVAQEEFTGTSAPLLPVPRVNELEPELRVVRPEPSKKATSPKEDLKRKGREANDGDPSSKVVEFEYADGRKQIDGSGSSKRSRDAKMHNISERKRRDRINRHMKTLQELIPGCNKNDKASMLYEAIEYVKALQLQVQMLSMSTGLGVNVGMNRTMVPFHYVPGGSAMQNPAAAVPHMPPRFYMPPSLIQPLPDPSRIQQTNQSTAVHYAQAPWAQNQEAVQPYTYNNREVVDPKNHQSG